jgi:hypothetical protein
VGIGSAKLGSVGAESHGETVGDLPVTGDAVVGKLELAGVATVSSPPLFSL